MRGTRRPYLNGVRDRERRGRRAMKVKLGIAVVKCVAWALLYFIKNFLGLVTRIFPFHCFLLSFVHDFLKYLDMFLLKRRHLEHP